MNLISKALVASSLALKSVFFSIADAVAYRGVRDPNKDITINHGDSRPTPRVEHALQLSTIWACTRLVAGAISTLPFFMYERVTVAGRDTRRLAREHYLYALLHSSPNADMTAAEFWQSIVTRLRTWGNAYVLKTFNGAGKIIALDPLDPALMTVRRLESGEIQYLYSRKGKPIPYTERDIWHIKDFSEDGLIGLSPIGVGWRSIAGAVNLQNASSSLFGNNMRPSAILTTKDYLSKDQRDQMKTKVMGSVFGSDQTGQMLLLEGMTEYKPLGINPVDAQMIEQVNASVEDLCRWQQIPPSMIGHGTMVSNWGTGREQINLGFLQYVLDPILVNIQQSIAKNLLSPAERLRYYGEFSREGYLRADSAGRSAFYSTMTQNGLMTRNEVRSLENWPAKDGGDELTVQSNLIPLNMLGKITTTAPPPG